MTTRSCCGQEHAGPTCPDGLTMCCMCFRRVPLDKLVVLEPGDGAEIATAPVYEDVCRPCRAREELRARVHG